MSYRIITCHETDEYLAEWNAIVDIDMGCNIYDWKVINKWRKSKFIAMEDVYAHKIKQKAKQARYNAIINPTVVEVIE